MNSNKQTYPKISRKKVKELLNVKKTQLKMLKLRGYDISDEEHIIEYTFEMFYNSYIEHQQKHNVTLRKILSQVYKHADKPDVAVYYSEEPNKTSLGKDNLCNFILYLDACKVKHGILITPKNLSSDAKKYKKKLHIYRLEIFLQSELICDPTEHFLVPKQELVPRNQRHKLFSGQNIELQHLPVIRPNDPVARFIGAQPGDVIHIHRINLLSTMCEKFEVYSLVQGLSKKDMLDSQEDL